MTVQWSPPSADGGCPITSYAITQDGVVAATQVEREFSLPVVVPAQTYSFSVRAESQVGSSPSSLVLSVVAAEAPTKAGVWLA